jgi:hypothetical protein
MLIGLDLDNTIICYDRLFHGVAIKMELIDKSVAPSKIAVKTKVMNVHGNDVWTELQAEVYGPSLRGALEYPGALAFAEEARCSGHDLVILSHKTRFPHRGVRHDLQRAALDWLEMHGWMSVIGSDNIEFHKSRAEKVAAIARRGCDIFIDDLPEIFAEPCFPPVVRRILFDPDRIHAHGVVKDRADDWSEIRGMILGSAESDPS